MIKYKIGVGINYWDDPKGLLTILEAPNFYENIFAIYLIDGRYSGREDKEENNPHLAQAIAREYPKIHYVKMYNVTQIEKRNKYWELAEKDDLDFMIVLDSDETCLFGENLNDSLEMCMKYPSQCFPLKQNHVQEVDMPRPRLFKKPFNFRHREHSGPNISHGSLWTDYGLGNQEIIQTMYKFSKIDKNTPEYVPSIYLTHDKKFRTKRRVDMDYKFYEENPNR